MREKNIARAAHALFLSQGDDKNSQLAERIQDKEVRRMVKDQGRVMILTERLLLPTGQHDYSEEEMYERLTNKLIKKGHRIQDNEEEDTEQYAAEKEAYDTSRAARVPSIWGQPLVEEEKDNKQVETEDNTVVVEEGFLYNLIKYLDFLEKSVGSLSRRLEKFGNVTQR